MRRSPGAIRFRDEADREILVVTPAYLQRNGVTLPPKLASLADAQSGPDTWPAILFRDGAPLALVTFGRRGEPEARAVIAALTRQNPKMRFVHVSSRSTAAARSVADAVGIELAFGGLDARGKVSLLRGLGRRTVWVGDGASAEAADVMAASDVSVRSRGLDARRTTPPTFCCCAANSTASSRWASLRRRIGRAFGGTIAPSTPRTFLAWRARSWRISAACSPGFCRTSAPASSTPAMSAG
ncbi:HAD family hydrolase [Chenggangzhangella methanolivorans]|uniref:HAD family hydrolase n=1 Tax=Chenggangzhangella methanolivorans TaxID=1437009 RepID=A0A9E6R963_9HYPH|nr:HAD family hydrolase [Chenggangzhangella methanolivorans]